MAIPDYQTLMLPLLKLVGSTKVISVKDAILKLSDQFHLSNEERAALLPSGKQPKSADKVFKF